MIDWAAVTANSLWISGCALALAAASYASWQAGVTQRRWRDVIGERNIRLWLNGAAILFSLGMAATARSGWETIVWLLLSVAFGVSFVRDLRRS